MKWQDASEIVAGLILKNRVASSAVRAENLIPPYSDIVKLVQEGVIAPEDLISRIGLSPVQAALEAEKSVNGAGNYADWVTILDKSYQNSQFSVELERFSKKLRNGEEIDSGKLRYMIGQMDEGRTGRVPLSEIVETELPFILTGYKPIDDHLGGFPEVGLIVVGGNPGAGKTTWMGMIGTSFAEHHKEKIVALYSLEMILPEIAGRVRGIKKVDESVENRIEINCDPLTASEVIADAAKIENLGLVIIDFVDYLIRGEVSEAKTAEVYRILAIGSKQLKCPVIILSQLSRSYRGGIPRPYHVRYSSLIEAFAWLEIMLYNPATDFYEERDAEVLPIIDNVGYMCVWKCRGGFRNHRDDSPGAIAVPFTGAKGWGNKSKWFSLKKEM